ncbi:LapA family protein [Mycolicibacterium lutetiense]|uniref:Integral membrane protein n=1 Tax=Mycolicibacterium lutetiense TaxID=1641992 RepID=A0ABS5A1B5_9MYCO|nr:lipopolysaccharide assembly LapA domain-containing protein [Mycolicibacterium lutetiense]MBP2455563.1 putative integral membrane protein [Mycolicibacterium lutetiense]
MTSDSPASPDLPEPTPSAPLPDPAKAPESGKAPAKSDKASEPKLTRAGALWSALILGFLVLIVLLIFIAQNTEPVPMAFLSWHWSLPTGVAILGAAVAGGLLTVAAGSARIFQLRRAAKKNFKAAQRS